MHDHRHLAGRGSEELLQLHAKALEIVQDLLRGVGVARLVAGDEREAGGLDPGHAGAESAPSCGAPAVAQASAGTAASDAIASIWPSTRSNSSSESTGVPSNGSSRWSSIQDLQPRYSGRTFTVTGRGIL